MGITEKQKNYIAFKRTVDAILSLGGMVALSPVFLAVILAIKAEDGFDAPVFFKQTRIGENKEEFELYKFRSMKMDAPHDVPTHLLGNPEEYTTRVGRFIRRTSIDELPQLWNILKGDMAVVGPRPALWNQYDLIAERDRYRANEVRPGLTGWAQINGRDEIGIKEKARLDGEYIENLGFEMDMRSLLGTARAVVKSEGLPEPQEPENDVEKEIRTVKA